MNMIVPLWSVPRSVSTGFERMMMERGDFKVIHEPFSYYFYQKAQGAAAIGMNVDPDHPQEYDEIVAMIRRAAETSPVFFKDMSYHAFVGADEALLAQFNNTFIIRHPKYTLVSGQKMNPESTLEEAGYETQFKMFETVKKITGDVPAIVDGEDLIADAHSRVKQYCGRSATVPARVARREARLKPEWKSWELVAPPRRQEHRFPTRTWRSSASPSTTSPRLKEMYDVCIPHYEKMYEERIRP